MPKTLADSIAQLRIRSGIHAKSSTNEFDPTGNAQLAAYFNEAQHHYAREAVTCTQGTDRFKNGGWLLKYAQLTASDGVAWLPPDTEVYIGDTDLTTLSAGLTAINPTKVISGCSGKWIPAGDQLLGPASATSVNVFYNSNLRDHWVSGTVSSGSSTTFVSSATPTYSTLPLSDWDDHYNGLMVRVTSADGSQTQIARITDYVASTRTFTVASWPTFTPSSGDSWGTLNRVPDDDLLMYHVLVNLSVQSPRRDEYERALAMRAEAWQDSVYNRHGYEQ